MKKSGTAQDLTVFRLLNIKGTEGFFFYEKTRKNYNDKKSDLYINIVKEIDDPQEVLTTLAALQLQVILYSKKVDNKKLFLDNMRALEITYVMNNYFKTYDITQAIKLLSMYKADIKALESIK